MSLERLLLTGRINDREYFAAIAAGGFPRRGWAHRHARIRRAVLEVLALLSSILMLIFVVWATAGASLPGDVR